MAKLLIATANEGKLDEFKTLIGNDVELVSLRDIGIESPEESGRAFAENASIKAAHGAKQSGLITVADDSGIVVDALDGAPGIWSARFAGPGATDEDNRRLLLQRLYDTSSPGRTARFVCVIAVADPNGEIRTFDGALEGAVAVEERGMGGFGYDPIFELEDGMTIAELPAEAKNRISHRARALKSALPYIHSLLAEQA